VLRNLTASDSAWTGFIRQVKHFGWFAHIGADASHLFWGMPDNNLPDHAS
jgi:hypothetical protein